MALIRTVAGPLRHEIDKIKASRFIASIWPVTETDEVAPHLDACRDAFRDANHHGFAWRLSGADRMRYSDDGEPSGTAGRPILQEIDGRNLVDVLVVVSRIFGGTRLGTGGLVRAYGGAAAEALDLADIVERAEVLVLVAQFGYGVTGPVQSVLAAFELNPERSDYGERVELELAVPIEQEAAVRTALIDATHGSIRFREP